MEVRIAFRGFVLRIILLMQVGLRAFARRGELLPLLDTPHIQARRVVESLFPHFPKVSEPTDELILLLALDLILA